MPKKASRPPRLTRLPKGHKLDVRRQEFNHLIDLLNTRGEVVNLILRDLEIQFQRIAQIQAEVDELKRVVARIDLSLAR